MRSLLCFVLVAAGVCQAQIVLAHEPRKGVVFEVEDQRETTVKVLLKAKARGSGEAKFISSESKYTEEVLGVGPLTLKRVYERSLREDRQVSQTDLEPMRSSQHGRTVLLKDLTKTLEGGGALDKQDREELRFERLLAALLPPQRVVERGDSWEISGSAVARSLFGDALPTETTDHSGAVVKLRSIKRKKSGEVAKLEVKGLRVKIKRTRNVPELTLDLKGLFEWDVVNSAPIKAELSGTVHYVVRVGDRISAEANGPYRWRYQAKLVEHDESAPADD